MDVYKIRLLNLAALQGGMSRQALAEKIGMDYGQVGHFFMRPETQGHRNIGARTARKIEVAFAKPTGWMDQIHPETAPALSLNGTEPQHSVKLAQVVTQVTQPALAPPTYSIPQLDIGGAMGAGELVPEYETIVGQMDVTRRWLHTNLPNITSPANVRLITAYGDSMEPDYKDGDVVFVDVGVLEVRVDAVYAFRLGDELFIKRLQRLPDGSINVLSTNEKYRPYLLTPQDRERAKVIGRVVGAWNWRRL